MLENNYDDVIMEEPKKSFPARCIEKFKKQPFLIGGWIGALTGIGYGVYRYKTRGPTFNMSIYLIQLRVLAQSVVVGSLMLGMIYEMYKGNIK